MPRRWITLFAIGVAATAITACGAPGAQSAPTNAAGSASHAAAGNSTHVPEQLQFTAKTIGGQTFSGTSLAGKPAVLWFWTPWCPTCQHEAPIFGNVAAANSTVTFVGVGAQEQASAMQAFVDKYQLGSTTQLADSEGTVWSKFGVTQQPAWAFVGADGKVDVVKGTLSAQELTERVNELAGR
ncbi:Soluble secreted antigen MPT53 precursor [Mycobacterium basiliense]|uniref:Soluble secreted antigen MPT53 n=1 Tax=Mycobacterium basiliense TaxID=2094119 RepID=A0A3S4BZR5_9MYCO|nr:redoxin domain-containing protein [Mycobacterium basiliense]VDM90837.1 Soluble secreted antigen MPT53 precursor [Mycobacterium basiliense]